METLDADNPPGFAIVDLRADQCRFAITPHDERHHRFCGAATLPGMVYCNRHAAMVRTAPRPRKLKQLGF